MTTLDSSSSSSAMDETTINNNRHTSDEEQESNEIWSSFSDSFREVQAVLDRNRVLIQQVNENHRSKLHENMVRNVALIQEINQNVSKIVALYSDLNVNFSTVFHQRNMDVDADNNLYNMDSRCLSCFISSYMQIKAFEAGGPFLPLVEPEAASRPLVRIGLSTSQPPPYTVEDGIGTLTHGRRIISVLKYDYGFDLKRQTVESKPKNLLQLSKGFASVHTHLQKIHGRTEKILKIKGQGFESRILPTPVGARLARRVAGAISLWVMVFPPIHTFCEFVTTMVMKT
ncbi:early flowering 4-like protein [Tanacetum coccineum]